LSTKTFGNGLIETRTYQTDNLNATITTPGVTSFGYTWDANKRKLTQTETGIPINNQVYTYDDEDRLTGFNRNNGDNQAWSLSLVGDWNQFNNNGNMENRTHNAVHEITTIDANPLVHDLKGNLTTNKNGQTYAWDIENRLTTATDNQNNTLGTYAYDALGRRVSKTVGATTTVFISDGMQKICEYENGVMARAYAYGSYIDEPLVMISGANKYYYHSNNLYSVAALTDAAGTVIERYKYDPYGKATILATDGTTVRAASTVNNPFLYDGYYHDTETGFEFVNARYYSSDLGRFIGRDPIGYVDGLNLYQGYFAPNGVDPLGLRWHKKANGDAVWIPEDGEDKVAPFAPYGDRELAYLRYLIPSWDVMLMSDAAYKYALAQVANQNYFASVDIGSTFPSANAIVSSSIDAVVQGTSEGLYTTANYSTGGALNTGVAIYTATMTDVTVTEGEQVLWVNVENQTAMIAMEGVGNYTGTGTLTGRKKCCPKQQSEITWVNVDSYLITKKTRKARREAVEIAWKYERDLVTMTGEGTRKWTKAEERELVQTGRVTGYQGHHIQNVAHHPYLSNVSDNIQFVTRSEHYELHNGNFRLPTTGPLLTRESMVGIHNCLK
jgi:RHS repeat-associated protein